MQGTSESSETRKLNNSFSTPEQAFANATPNNAAGIGSVNSSPAETRPVGIDPASPETVTTAAAASKAQRAKEFFFGSPLRTGLTLGVTALFASVGKTIVDCANGNCTMTAEEMQRMLHITNATLTTVAKARITAGVDLLVPVVTGFTSSAAHAAANKMSAFFARTPAVNPALTDARTEESALLPPTSAA